MQLSLSCQHKMVAQSSSAFAQNLPKLTCLALALALTACGTAPRGPVSSERAGTPPVVASNKPERSLPVLPAAGSGRGGYYQDDGPGDAPPAGLYEVPDAEPKIEPLARTGNKSYVVFGKTYTPILDERPFVQRGVGSWYGRKFHGQRTSSGEPYDMYKMTAAHPLLPIPSYARVTNLMNGKQVIVKVNDRGPFHSGRIVDLSYTAALKLGLLGKGSHEVEIERLLPDEIARINARRQSEPQLAGATSLPVVSNFIASKNKISSQPLTLSERDAQQIRAMDRALRNEHILPAPSAASIDALLSNSPDLAANDSSSSPAALRFEQNINATSSAEKSNAQLAQAELGKNNLAGGFYLQLGAFSLFDNAQAERAKLAQTSLPSIEVVQIGSVFRIYSGPFSSRAEAQNAALLARSGKALVVQR